MVRDQVRMLVVVLAATSLGGCGWSGNERNPANVWDSAATDATRSSVAQAPGQAAARAPSAPIANPYASLPMGAVAPAAGYAGNGPPGVAPAYHAPPVQTAAGPLGPPFAASYPPQAASPTAPYATPQPPRSPPPPQNPAPLPYPVPGVPFAGQQPGVPPVPSRQEPVLSEFEPARIVARVGNEYILAGDVLGAVNQLLEPYREKLSETQYEQQKQLLVRRMVTQMLETKLLYVAFLRNVPEEHFEEALGNVREQAFAQYDEQELDKAIEQAKVKTAAELDAYLRKFGTSLYKQKLQYTEIQLGRAGVRQNIDINPEVTHQEMLDYYHEHLDDYAYEAKARWEKLTARFDKTPNRQQAWAHVATLGDQVLLGGAPMTAVAKRHSHGLDRDDGGYHDWTTRGSLRSEQLNQAIFSLPIGKLSGIIEDETGFHIVRVIERQDAGRTSFLEAQVEIKETILNEKRQAQVREYIAKLRERIPVWTVFDDEPPKGDDDATRVGSAPSRPGSSPPGR